MEYKLQKSAVDLTDLAIGIVVLGIVVSIGATILINLSETRLAEQPLTATCNTTSNGGTGDVTTGCDASYLLPVDAATGLAEYGNWFSIIVIVGVAAVVLSLIFMAFGGRTGVSY